jgi:multidrug efflux system membrane fusion protein
MRSRVLDSVIGGAAPSGVPTRPGLARRWAGALLLLGAVGLTACSDGKGGQAQAKAPAARDAVPVTVGTAASKAVPLQIKAIGSVQAYASVTIKSQVDGEVAQIHFTEGQEVKKGELLFTLDRRPLEATVRQAEAVLARDTAQQEQAEAVVAQTMAAERQAEANLARDTAQLENARSQLRRYKALIDEGAISRELYDQVQTTTAALEATIRADQAAVVSARATIRAAQAAVENIRAVIRADQALLENARVQLEYTTIRAPMDARTGNLLVRVGSAVKARDETARMLVLNQVHPIYAVFSLPEQYLPDIKRYMAQGGIRVEAAPQGPSAPVAAGTLSFVDNSVDATTGTIQLKATFANPQTILWPGQFVNVLVTLTVQPDLVVIPSQAVQTGQQGSYVYVVRSDATVESRAVRVGRRVDGETVVEQGVSAGEQVVTDGHLRLVSGTRVQIKDAAASGQAR